MNNKDPRIDAAVKFLWISLYGFGIIWFTHNALEELNE